MGSVLPVGRILRSIAPSNNISPALTGVVTRSITPAAMAVAPAAAVSIAAIDPAAAASAAAAQAHSDQLAARDDGLLGTVQTSLRGLLNLSQLAPQRKTLLGE